MRVIKVLMSVAAAAVIFLGSAAAVASDKKPGSGPSPYTECGIGAALFPETHWAAVTSNIIWDLGLTAITSATASPETCNGKPVQAAKFIYDTYDNVLEDTAKGDGEYVGALLQIYGCSEDSRNDIIETIRIEIGKDVSKDNYAEMSRIQKAEAYFDVINTEVQNDFAANCSA